MSELNMRKVIIILNNKGDNNSVMVKETLTSINVTNEFLDLNYVSLPIETAIIEGHEVYFARQSGVSDDVVRGVLIRHR